MNTTTSGRGVVHCCSSVWWLGSTWGPLSTIASRCGPHVRSGFATVNHQLEQQWFKAAAHQLDDHELRSWCDLRSRAAAVVSIIFTTTNFVRDHDLRSWLWGYASQSCSISRIMYLLYTVRLRLTITSYARD